MPIEALFWGKVNVSAAGDCWMWLGAIDRDGYGVFSYWMPDGKCRTRRAWQWAVELAYGERPSGLQACAYSRTCANPGHMRPKRGKRPAR